MAAYMITEIEITDPVRYEEYRALVPASLEKYGGAFIARGGQVRTLEGDWDPKRLVITAWPSVERALEWYHSEEYREAKEIRQQASTGKMILVEGM
ncbi:MAG: DUF1330 domain-containing protein [Chloroflexota bacterium]|nr:DUF1330 domain-containing protein [Chloroflexota bacterium]